MRFIFIFLLFSLFLEIKSSTGALGGEYPRWLCPVEAPVEAFGADGSLYSQQDLAPILEFPHQWESGALGSINQPS